MATAVMTEHGVSTLAAADRLFGAGNVRSLLAGRPLSRRSRATVTMIGEPTTAIDAPFRPDVGWWRRAAAELRWGAAMHGLRAKAAHSVGRRVAAAWWRLRRSARNAPGARRR